MKDVISIVRRNKFDISGRPVHKGVNLEQWSERENVGDFISSVVFEWMIKKKGLSPEAGRNVHLFSIGSILGLSRADGVVWGSGIISAYKIRNLIKRSSYLKYDIRALRGPITREVCSAAGYECDNVPLGDPAILLPLIYEPSQNIKKYRFCVVNHYINEGKHNYIDKDIVVLSAGTNDYKSFIDTLCASEMVISSSLHGIILAEAYGIPALWLLENMANKTLKYYDYYYSTNRYNIPVARTIEEAFQMKPIALPESLSVMQDDLIKAFPFDLWS